MWKSVSPLADIRRVQCISACVNSKFYVIFPPIYTRYSELPHAEIHYSVAYPGWHTPGVQTEDGILAPLGKLKNGAPRRRCWMGEGGSMLEVVISFSDNVIGIRFSKIALTLNWLVLNVRASSTRKFEMLSEKWAHYSVNFMNNFGLSVWVPINRYYWVILGIIVKNVFKKIFKINVKRVYCCLS